MLRTVTYDNTAASPNTATRLISVVATDSRGASNTAISSLRYGVPNTAPVAQADSYTVTKGGVLTVSVPGLLANDTDANSDPLSAELASGPANGTLTLATSGSFVYTPNVGFSGGDAFTYRAFDGSLYSAPVTVAITVTPVNVAPVGTDATLVLLQNQTHVFAAADFSYSDPGDTPANALAAVQLSTLPTAGTLTLAGTAVGAGQWVSAADLAAGRLMFSSGADGYGTGYASLGFQVRDDGGTANGGVDLDAVGQHDHDRRDFGQRRAGGRGQDRHDARRHAATPSLPPTSVSPIRTTPAADVLLNVRITTLPAAGTLRNNGSTVTAGQFVIGGRHRRRQARSSRRLRTPTARATRASPSRCRTTAARPMAASISMPTAAHDDHRRDLGQRCAGRRRRDGDDARGHRPTPSRRRDFGFTDPGDGAGNAFAGGEDRHAARRRQPDAFAAWR